MSQTETLQFHKVFNPDADPNEVDPVVREGNLLTNVFNRVLRSLFYTWQKDFDGVIPYGTVDADIEKQCAMSMLKYEKLMKDNKFHMISYELDSFIRNINKYWVKNSNNFEGNVELEKQTIINTLHMVRIAMLLLHPVAPSSTEKLAEFLKVDKAIFSWANEEKTIYDFMEDPQNHKPNFLEPKQDFFKKHPSQLGDEE